MLKATSLRQLIKRLKLLGFNGPFSGTKHQFMIKGELKIRVPSPHHKKDISPALLNEILKQIEISKEQWNNFK